MAGTLVKKVMLRIASDDGDTEEKLDKISAKADELARKHPDLKVKIDTAAASAKLAALRMELKRTDDEAKDGGSRFGALGGVLNTFTLGMSGGIGEMSMFQKVMLGLNLATGLGEPLVAGLTVAVGGLTSGIAAAGAGLGVFGLVAKSVWSGVSTNITAATAAENKMASAKTLKQQTADAKQFEKALKGLNPGQRSLVIGAANAESGWHSFVQSAAGGVASVLVPALNLVPRALQLAKGFLGPVEGALRGVVAMVSKGLNSQGFGSFISMLQKNAGPMITKLAVAIGHVVVGIGGILKAFMPVAQQMGHGLDDITGKFAKWGQTLGSHSGFKSLMSMFKSETPMAVHALSQLAKLIKTVVSNMAGMSTFSNSKMLLQALNPVLSIMNKLAKVPGLVNLILYLKLASDAGGKLKTAITGVQGGISDIKNVASAASNLGKGFSSASSAASEATGVWGSMGGKLSTVAQKLGLLKAAQGEAAVATEGETAAQGELDVAMDANPIGLIVLAVAALGIGMYELIKHVTPVRDFFKDLWKDLKNWFSDGINFIKSHWKLLPAIFLGPLGIVVTLVLTHFKQIKQIISDALHAVEDVAKDVWHWFVDYIMIQVDAVKTVLSWFGKLGSLFRGWWDDAVNAVVSVVGRLISFVRGIPGKVISALANLGSLLFNAGKNAILGFIHGMGSMLGEVENVAESIGKSALHGVESFLHIGSPSKVLFDRGVMSAKGFELGIDAGRPGVGAAAARMAQAAVPGGGAAGAGAGGSGWMELRAANAAAMDVLQFLKMIWPQIRLEVRERGGGGNDSAQRAFAQVTAG